MTINILSAGLVLMAAIVIYAFFHPFSQPHAVQYAKTDIYVMKNAIDSSKAYLEASLDFSVYQAFYDVAKRGGLGDTVSTTTYSNRLEPTVGCAKTDQRIGSSEDEVIGCIPGKFGCTESEGEIGYTNEGYEVGLLQLLLKSLKYSITVDCKFGKGTLSALKEFQKKSGIAESGFVDSETVNKLRAAFTYDNCGDYFYGCSNRYLSFWNADITEESLKNNLKTAIVKNINSYTSGGYRFLDLPMVYLPTYTEQNVVLTETIKGAAVSLSEGNIKISKSNEKEEVVDLESPSPTGKMYNIDIFGMFRKAKIVADYVNGRGCNQIADETKTEDGFKINITVVNKATNPSCKATVKISVTQDNPKKFPVFNGAGVSFEPVSFEFLVGFGQQGGVSNVGSAGAGTSTTTSVISTETITKAKLEGKESWSDFVVIESQYLASGAGTTKLRNDVYLKLKSMIDDAKKAGVNILVASSYRSYDYQLGIWERPENIAQGFEARKKASAIPGTSQHEWGTDIDFYPITSSFGTAPQFAWLQANADKYGFYLEYPKNNPEGYEYEPWHWTYKPVSNQMKVEYENLVTKQDLCDMENVVREIYGVADLTSAGCSSIAYPFSTD